MGDTINGYELQSEFSTVNAGFSRWASARKNGEDYILKEFLTPKYPVNDEFDDSLHDKMRKECEIYEIEKKDLYEKINAASDGNLIRIEEFFRKGSSYYIAMKKVRDSGILPHELQKYRYSERLLLCMTVAHAIKGLHEKHIVHSDIKPPNVLIQFSPSDKLVGKIIDFDASFFEENPPKAGEELVGDQIYFSPEAVLFILEEEVKLNCKSDIFSMGLLFHQYLTGALPSFDEEAFDYACIALLEEENLIVSQELTDRMRGLITSMLSLEPKERPDACEVFEIIQKEYFEVNGSVIEPPHPTDSKSLPPEPSESPWTLLDERDLL